MNPTHRAVASATLAVLLAGLAVVVKAPFLLLAPAGIAAWVIGRQYTLYRSVREIVTTAETDVVVSRRRAYVDQSVSATLVLSRNDSRLAQVTAEITSPPGVIFETPLICTSSQSDEEATASTKLTAAAAGQYQLPEVFIQITDPTGLFTETLSLDTDATLIIEPRTPRDLHVGQGGDSIATAYGDHPGGQSSGGVTPAELRQYTPGDAADQIDWKATARLNEPYIREFEAETDRRTVIVVDHRATTQVGPSGQTICSYAREAALGAVKAAAENGDPLGLWTVGDEGVTSQYLPQTGRQQYEQVVTQLRQLTPTSPTSATTANADTPSLRSIEAQARLTTLDQSTSTFAQTLRPFFATQDRYVARLTGDPLYGTIQQIKSAVRGSVLVILITTDDRRSRLEETIQLAADGTDHVLALLAPPPLFDRERDLESTYTAYVEFEDFRRRMHRLSRVTAYELVPGDRLAWLLERRQG